LTAGIIAAAASAFAAILSFLGAILASLFTRRSQLSLEKTKAALEQVKADRNALLDYQYETRRRMYRECEPLIFRLVELCDEANNRILTLARMSRTGSGYEVEQWISDEDNQHSTLYRILAPLAAFTLLAERLTLFDLSLNPRMYVQYILAKTMVDIYRHETVLAKIGTAPLNYKPNTRPPDNQVAPPAVYAVQGISDERLDSVLAAFVEDGPTSRRVISYPTFLRKKDDKKDALYAPVLNLSNLLRDFSPRSRPVLWRVLVAHSVLCNAITKSYNSSVDLSHLASLVDLTLDERKSLFIDTDHTGNFPQSYSHVEAALLFLKPRMQRSQDRLLTSREAE
jgi:hypothetical protein